MSSTPAGQPLFSLQLSSPSCLAGSVCCLQGVRIPTLGSFDTIPELLRVRARELTVQRPVFRLARNLADAHQLTDDKAYLPGELSAYSPGSCQLREVHVSPPHGQGDQMAPIPLPGWRVADAPQTQTVCCGAALTTGSLCATAARALLCGFPGDKLLEPLRYAQIAAATFVSAKRVVGCIQATMSLFSRCIRKGRNVALILKDIGMLLIEGTRVQMKYYHDFLEMMTGKDTLKEALLRVSVSVLHCCSAPFAIPLPHAC